MKHLLFRLLFSGLAAAVLLTATPFDASAKTKKIKPMMFADKYSGQDSTINPIFFGSVSGTWGVTTHFTAPVSLPAGSTIDGMTYYYHTWVGIPGPSLDIKLICTLKDHPYYDAVISDSKSSHIGYPDNPVSADALPEPGVSTRVGKNRRCQLDVSCMQAQVWRVDIHYTP